MCVCACTAWDISRDSERERERHTHTYPWILHYYREAKETERGGTTHMQHSMTWHGHEPHSTVRFRCRCSQTPPQGGPLALDDGARPDWTASGRLDLEPTNITTSPQVLLFAPSLSTLHPPRNPQSLAPSQYPVHTWPSPPPSPAHRQSRSCLNTRMPLRINLFSLANHRIGCPSSVLVQTELPSNPPKPQN